MARVLLALLVAALLCSPAIAQDGDGEGHGSGVFIKKPYNDKPPQEHHDGLATNQWKLVPDDETSKAKGKVELGCYSDDKDYFKLDAQGLDPHSVYTVWFSSGLKEGADRAGVGKEPFSFKTGGGGSVLYQAPLKTCPLIKYRWIIVLKHPDGNPAKTAGAVRVLKARMVSE